MPDEENYHIRRDEWNEMRSTLKEVRDAMLKLVERENARDDRIAWANDRAEAAHAHAERALVLANELKSDVVVIQERIGVNAKTLDGWQSMVMKIAAGVCIAGICGVAGYILAGGAVI